MIKSIIDQIAATRSSNEKLKIMKLHANNDTLHKAFHLAYNKRISYYIKKLPPVVRLPLVEMTLDDFMDRLVADIASRAYTGHSALKHLSEMMGKLSADDMEIARRIVLRDLECGASGSSANKVWKGTIPEQPCMTASSFSEKSLSNIVYPAYAQLKADGTRCMIIKENGEVTAWSRNGKNFVGIAPIIKAVERCELDNFVLDGELVYKPKPAKSEGIGFLFGDDSEQEEVNDVADRQTGNGIVTKSQEGGKITPEEADCIHFQCWDIVNNVDDYWSGVHKIKYTERLDMATKAVLDFINDPHLEMIETTVVNNRKEAEQIFNRYVDMGLEGIILKNMHGVWEFKRSKNQVKFKVVKDIDMTIVGYYAHEKDPNKIGGFTVRSKCGMIENNVGSGLTDTTEYKDENGVWIPIPLEDRHDLDRELLMSKGDELLDCVLELECNGFTTRRNRKPHEPEFKLFLPVIKKLRFDKSPEQANTFEEIFG